MGSKILEHSAPGRPGRGWRRRCTGPWQTLCGLLSIAAAGACTELGVVPEEPSVLSIMRVTTITSGADRDDEYKVELVVDSVGGDTLVTLVSTFTIPATGSRDIKVLTVQTNEGGSTYRYAVSLLDVAANCSIAGGNSRTGTVDALAYDTLQTTTEVMFDVACTPLSGGENLLVDPGFEGAVQLGLPTLPGVWGGEVAALVGAENGITPADGASMLRFLAGTGQGASADAFCAVFQIVDVGAYRTEIDAGQVEAEAIVRFNRVAGAGKDIRFVLIVSAFAGDPATFPEQELHATHLLHSTIFIDTDADPATWEPLSQVIVVPSGTDFLVFELAGEDGDHLPGGQTIGFDGSYADVAALRLRIM